MNECCCIFFNFFFNASTLFVNELHSLWCQYDTQGENVLNRETTKLPNTGPFHNQIKSKINLAN